MGVAGLLLMATATAELAVQLFYGERPHLMLLGGLFLVGVLAVSRAVSRRPAVGAGAPNTASNPSSRSIPPRGILVWPQHPND
jgi:hypothetical protein